MILIFLKKNICEPKVPRKLTDNAKLQGKARSDMTVEERIEAADRRKIEGNEYFKEKKFEEAMQQYEMVSCLLMSFFSYCKMLNHNPPSCSSLQAIAYMGDDFMFQLFGKYRDMALAVKNPCHLNMAACLIKLKRFDEAIAQCTIVCYSSTLHKIYSYTHALTLHV